MNLKSVGLAFDDFAGLDASGADANALAGSGNLGSHRSQVDVPTATRGVVGVRYVVSELRALAAEITFGCHGETPILNCRDLHSAHRDGRKNLASRH